MSDVPDHIVSLLSSLPAGRRRRMPDQLYPSMVELEYANAIVARLRSGFEAYGDLRAALPSLLAEAEVAFARGDQRADVDAARQATDYLDRAYGKFIRQFNPSDLEALATYFGERTSRHQRQQLVKQLKAGLGLSVPVSDVTTPEILRFFALENATKIGGIAENMHQQIANLVATAFSKRMKPETLAQLIQERADVAESYARGLATQQIGKLNGQLDGVRQQALGITAYFWITKKDENVRLQHKKRHEKRFHWRRPPKGGHPGEDYGCRCKARPDLAPILAAISAARAAASVLGSTSTVTLPRLLPRPVVPESLASGRVPVVTMPASPPMEITIPGRTT